jgi:hypothetical protein
MRVKVRTLAENMIPVAERGIYASRIDGNSEWENNFVGQVIEVLAVLWGESPSYFYQISPDRPFLVSIPVSLCEVVDHSLPSSWVLRVDPRGNQKVATSLCLAPIEWQVPSFSEFVYRLIDDDPGALSLFWKGCLSAPVEY